MFSRKAQGSAVPVFLGMIDLAKVYFLHGAGEIRHMLVMGWGGENTATIELAPWLRQEIHRSNKEIKALGIIHKDLRGDNILCNKELGRALIIDFHRSTLKHLPISKRPQTVKRQLCRSEPRDVKTSTRVVMLRVSRSFRESRATSSSRASTSSPLEIFSE
jgi:serine/threonine protein kinase